MLPSTGAIHDRKETKTEPAGAGGVTERLMRVKAVVVLELQRQVFHYGSGVRQQRDPDVIALHGPDEGLGHARERLTLIRVFEELAGLAMEVVTMRCGAIR